MKTNTKLMIAAAAMSGLFLGTSNRASAQPVSSSHDSSITRKMSTELKAGVKANTLGDDKDKHECKGKNDCKGKGGCKSDKHECKGKNDCKGQGGCKGHDDKKEDKKDEK